MRIKGKIKMNSRRLIRKTSARLNILFFGIVILLVINSAGSGSNDYSGSDRVFSNITTSVPRFMTYQGILKDSIGDPVPDSVFDITFRIFSQDIGGVPEWDQVVPCTTYGGLFKANLDILNLSFDVDYWLELEIDSEIMSPRQKMSMSPYAAAADTVDFARNAAGSGWIDDGTVIRMESSSDSIGIGVISPMEKLHVDGDMAVSGNAYIGSGHIFSGSAIFIAGQNNTVSDNWSVIRGGEGNNIESQHSVISGGQLNEITGSGGAIGGGKNNSIAGLEASIGGGYNNAANGDYSSIAGGSNNSANGLDSFVGGGSGNNSSDTATTIIGGINNTATSNGATVSGGQLNSANGNYNAAGGGYNNNASGNNDFISITGGQNNYSEAYAGAILGGADNQTLGNYSSIGGGFTNTANGEYNAIKGGRYNSTSFSDATIGGGSSNNASANDATISGGYGNVASGSQSVVGGGVGNISSGTGCAVGGGESNSASIEYSTISGGYNNSATEYCAVGGGSFNSVSYDGGTVAGGRHNSTTGYAGTVAGGYYNSVESDYGFVAGGHYNLVNSSADYSYLFSDAEELGQDSTFMVYMPHIRFGNESSGYEFPGVDGSGGQMMATDGSGQLGWATFDTSPYGWSSPDWRVLLHDGSDSVGIGTSAPASKLDVNGTVNVTGFELTAGYQGNYALTSDAQGNGTWQPQGLFSYQTSANYIPRFSTTSYATYLLNSSIYQDLNKIGIGTTSPSKMLTVDGRIYQNNTTGNLKCRIFAYEGWGGLVYTYGTSGSTYDYKIAFAHVGGQGDLGSISVYDYYGDPRAFMYAYDGYGNFYTRAASGAVKTRFASLHSYIPNYRDNGYMSANRYDGTPMARFYVDTLDQGIVSATIKSFRVPNPDRDGTDIWYACPEGPEAAAYIRGTASLVNGECVIDFPQHFKSVISDEGMSVELTPLSIESKGLAAIEMGSRRIVVRELRNGNGTYEFDYLIWAVRKGHEEYRVIRPNLEGNSS